MLVNRRKKFMRRYIDEVRDELIEVIFWEYTTRCLVNKKGLKEKFL